ncbi:MAG: hypothetical protein J6S84_09045 [Bacteroidales bacterium]|nr:hypothetical protein [Bacteroidales bacterium]
MTNTAKKKREHTYTKAERSKINKIKKVKITDKPSIPKSKNTESAQYRKKKIAEHMQEIYGVHYCKELNGDVAINQHISNVETRFRASTGYKSTILALNIENLLSSAVKIYDAPPKGNKQQKSFVRMHVLIAAVRGIGYAKITIGEYENQIIAKAKYCHYCVTSISVHALKNKA